MVELEIRNFRGPSSWDWHLRSAAMQVEQSVDLDPTDPRFDLITDLYRNIWRIESEPAHRRRSEERLLRRVGSDLGELVLSKIGPALIGIAPITVRVVVPPEAIELVRIPFELANWGGQPLSLSGVTFSYCPPGAAARRTIEHRVRILAVFALPEGSSALGLAHERRMLSRHLAQLGPAVDLRVLQYGVTTSALREAVADPAGWDIIHIAGHGTAGVLHLEADDGTKDAVDSDELLRLLEPAAPRTALVVLSSCESGVARTARRVPGRPSIPVPVPGAATSLGYELARRLDCAVLAMRYPVDDEFSVAFTRAVYLKLVAEGRTLDIAVRLALQHEQRTSSLAAATPMLFGPADVRVSVPRNDVTRATADTLPAESERFVGRTRTMIAIDRVLHADNPATSLLLTGMPGIGKTACALEAAHTHLTEFDEIVWHTVHAGDSVETLRAALAPGAPAADAVEAIRARRVLIVLDQLDVALTPRGAWRRPEVGRLIADLIRPDARARIVLTCDRPVPIEVAKEGLPLLTKSEAQLLVRQIDEQSWTVAGARPTPDLLGPWLVAQGHPALIAYLAGNDNGTMRTARAWEVISPVAGDRPKLARTHPGTAIQKWAKRQSRILSAAGCTMWQLLCSLEASDRDRLIAEQPFEILRDDLGLGSADYDATLSEIVRAGLAETGGRIHPAVARVGRGFDAKLTARCVAAMVVVWEFWRRKYEAESDSAGWAAAAASAVPYLMRSGDWHLASVMAEQALHADDSPRMASRLLPFLNESIIAPADPALELANRYIRAIAVLRLDRSRGIEEITGLHARAQELDDVPASFSAAATLVNELIDSDPGEAFRWLQETRRLEERADLNPWSKLVLDLKMAKHFEEDGDPGRALSRAEDLLSRVNALQTTEPQPANSASIRDEILAFAANAARRAGQVSRAQQIESELRTVSLSSGAAEDTVARQQFNEAVSAIGYNSGNERSIAMLVAALGKFDGVGYEDHRSLVLRSLAAGEVARGMIDEAIELTHAALRASYAAGVPANIATAHTELAEVLAAARQDDLDAEISTYLLAAAVINMRVSRGAFVFQRQSDTSTSLQLLAARIARCPAPVPQTFRDLCDHLRDMADVDLAALLAGIERVPVVMTDGEPALEYNVSNDAPGDSVTDTLIWAAHMMPAQHLLDVEGHPELWTDLAVVIAGALNSGDDAALSAALSRLRMVGWGTTADALLALAQDGEAAARLLGNLDETDAAVVQLVLRTATSIPDHDGN